jgi:hypothetical protein
MHGGELDYNAAEAHWAAVIQSSGAQAARDEYLKEGGTLPAWESHTLAHSFGEALFKAKGVSGIAYCGDEFVYGCYHQFIGDATVKLGLGILPQLYAACEKLGEGSFGCEHGIGHGIVGYLGYSLPELKQSLALCTSLDPSNPRAGCVDGAFMEYNIHELGSLTDDGHFIPRPLTSKNVTAPCYSLGAIYELSCTFELPDWWMAALDPNMDMDDRFARIGAYCSDIEKNHAEAGRTCFEGAGYLAPAFTNFDTAQVASYCAKTTDEQQGRLLCLSGAVWRYRAAKIPGFSDTCGAFGLTGAALEYCKDFSVSTHQHSDDIPVPAL